MGEIGHFGKNILKYMKFILNKLACGLSQILQAGLSPDMPQADISNSLRSTSGATHANLLAAGIAASPVPTYCSQQRWGYRDSNSCSQNICNSDALPTELNRDRQKIEISLSGCKFHFLAQLVTDWVRSQVETLTVNKHKNFLLHYS